MVKVAALTALILVAGGRVVPWLLTTDRGDAIARALHSDRLALALGISVASAQFFGVSMALGAFLAGLVVGRSEFSVRAASEALPMRDAFAVLFFVSVGMLLDPGFVMDAPVLILSALAVVLIGKPLAALVLVLLLGYPRRRRASDRRRPGANRRVLVHRRSGRRATRARHRRCEEHAHRDRDGVDRRQPPPLPRGRAARRWCRSDGQRPRRSPGGPSAERCRPRPAASRGRHRLRPGRQNRRPPPAPERRHAHHRRPQHRHGARPARGGPASHLRRRRTPGHAGERGRANGGCHHPERGRAGRGAGGDHAWPAI